MVIDLQEPFRSIWRKGYLQQHPSGRRYVCLYNSDTERTIISYARYLMSVKLGYVIPDEYQVDHRDNDKTNDDINNLQLLIQKDNNFKETINRYGLYEDKEVYGYECINCQIRFIISSRERNKRIHCGVEYAFCSRSCATSFHKATISKPQEIVDQIKNLRAQGHSSYSISDQLNISRNTVMKYW